ncbi:uncharacterized protein [Nicotiana tomentosiformis]|uniref:uncharacterized protein n=1 Tax=Nicotiana tomentosiformis TaxID=4098 RepID=UPI00388CE569
MVFLEKFVPQSRREELRQGDMSMMQYDMRFFELSRHAGERVSGATFDEVVDIAWQIEMVRSLERGEKVAKRPRGLGDYNDVPSRGQFYRSRVRSYRHAQTSRLVHSGASSNHGSYSSHQSQSYLSALPAPSTLCIPLVQGSYVPGPSGSHSSSRGPPQNSPPFFEMECYECGELGHVRKYCPRRMQGAVQQRSQATTSVPVAPPPAQPAQGGAQSARGLPRGGGRSGGGQGRFYAFPARPDIVASDAVITCIILVCHREASIIFDPGFIIFF